MQREVPGPLLEAVELRTWLQSLGFGIDPPADCLQVLAFSQPANAPKLLISPKLWSHAVQWHSMCIDLAKDVTEWHGTWTDNQNCKQVLDIIVHEKLNP